MGPDKKKTSGQKGKIPPVPSLKLATASSEDTPETRIENGQPKVSHTARHIDKVASFRGKREQNAQKTRISDSSTRARAVSSTQGLGPPRIENSWASGGSYKDVLLTPRYNPRQSGGMTSRVLHHKSPLTARASIHTHRSPEQPVQTRQSKPDAIPSARAMGSVPDGPSSIISNIAAQIKRLEETMDSDEGHGKYEAMLYVSQAIQTAAEYIEIPAGILEMLRFHENQRIRPRIGNQIDSSAPRKMGMPSTPKQHTAATVNTDKAVSKIKSISLKISSIEKLLSSN